MTQRLNRRQVLKSMGAACAAMAVPSHRLSAQSEVRVAGRSVEITLTSVSPHTFRLTVAPVVKGAPAAVPANGSLALISSAKPAAHLRGEASAQSVQLGHLRVDVSADALTFGIKSAGGDAIQQLKIDSATGVVSFATGDSPLLGLGEGGPQFDRRGSTDAMRSGQGGYKLATHGGRVPVPWLIGTAGWAMFFHQPFGTFDFTGADSKFQPSSADAALPLDIFFVTSREPAIIMAEYARLTGHPEMPPLWTLGYQQSHRTLASPEEVLADAKTFREKKLPCDALIYLGTGFCPSGWNTDNGSFVCNSRAFPDPKQMLDELHKDHFHVVPHVVILSDKLRGTVHDACELRESTKPARRATGTRIAKSSPSAWTAGGPMRATRSIVRRGSFAIECTGKAPRSTARTSVPTRCIATATPACSDTPRSSGRAMFIRPGRR